MGKIWPTPPGTGRTRLLPPSQCSANHHSSNQPLALPTWKQNQKNQRPGHLLFSEVDLPVHLYTSPPFPPQKPTLVRRHRLTPGARRHLTAGSLQPDTTIFLNKANKAPQTAFIIWDCNCTTICKQRSRPPAQGTKQKEPSLGPETYSPSAARGEGATEAHRAARTGVQLPPNPNQTHSKRTGGTGTRCHTAEGV